MPTMLRPGAAIRITAGGRESHGQAREDLSADREWPRHRRCRGRRARHRLRRRARSGRSAGRRAPGASGAAGSAVTIRSGIDFVTVTAGDEAIERAVVLGEPVERDGAAIRRGSDRACRRRRGDHAMKRRFRSGLGIAGSSDARLHHLAADAAVPDGRLRLRPDRAA